MLRRVLAWIGTAALLWIVVLLTIGGFDVTVAGVQIRSHNPRPIALVALLAWVGFYAAGGRIRISWRSLSARLADTYDRVTARPTWIAVALAVTTMTVSLAYSTRTAGASDIYGYMSQADLWLAGEIKVSQPWMTEVPWPDKVWSFSPFGYRPAPHGEWAIVPTYSPGLPLLLAAAKALGGQCGLFLVVPLCAAIAVFSTYVLGRQLGSAAMGLIAAALLAASPASLGVMMDPLSDVPAMAVWTMAFVCLFGRSRKAALFAGLLSALAVLIRPNLVVLVVPMGVWYLVRLRAKRYGETPPEPSAGRRPAAHSRDSWPQRLRDAGIFSIGVAPGILVVALLNNALFGSPLSSGYGQLDELMHWSRIGPNLVNYLRWFAESQTPVALLGFLALIIPLRRFWPAVTDRTIFIVIGGYLAALWLQYGAYLGFDSWGFLRFLLPSWPLLLIGAAAVLLVLAQTGWAGRMIVTLTVIAMMWWQVGYANRHGVFDQRQAARHILLIAPLVRAQTAENSVVIALQHSGAARYYTGRVTLRYDYLPADTLDRDLDWLRSRGVEVYALFDERELAEFKAKFAGQQSLASLDQPVIDYRPGNMFLFHFTLETAGGPRPDRRPRRPARPLRLRTASADAAAQAQALGTTQWHSSRHWALGTGH